MHMAKQFCWVDKASLLTNPGPAGVKLNFSRCVFAEKKNPHIDDKHRTRIGYVYGEQSFQAGAKKSMGHIALFRFCFFQVDH